MSASKFDERQNITALLAVMDRLRDPVRGCPWDLQQDFSTIVPSTLEEAYELADSIEHGNFPHVAEELGDLLFQVVFYSQIAREEGCELEYVVRASQDDWDRYEGLGWQAAERYAAGGSKSRTSSFARPASACRIGARLSRIQNPRP